MQYSLLYWWLVNPMRHAYCPRELHPSVKVMVKRRALLWRAWEETDYIRLLVNQCPNTMEDQDFNGFLLFVAFQITPQGKKGIRRTVSLTWLPHRRRRGMYSTTARSMRLATGPSPGEFQIPQLLWHRRPPHQTPFTLVKAQCVMSQQDLPSRGTRLITDIFT